MIHHNSTNKKRVSKELTKDDLILEELQLIREALQKILNHVRNRL
jgi:hypothetical protein